MAAELDLQPLEPPSLNPAITTTTSTVVTTAIAAPTPPAPTPSENPAPKRQRRPSVRLGEIGDQPATHTYDSHMRRPKHSYSKFPKETLNHHHHQTLNHSSSSKSSAAVKARSLTHLVNGNSHDSHHNTLTLDSNFDFSHRRPTKPRKPVPMKRARSNWVPKLDDSAVNDTSKDTNNCRGDEDDDDDDELENVGFRDYDHESDSPTKENSPVHSGDNNNNNNLEGDLWQRRIVRGGFGSEFDAPELNYKERKGGFGGVNDGVRNWLEELGLSRYTPVFEIHEVDDEVLPMLTLEDLKDMGINAVGSRRKMFSAIQKLRKGIS